MDVHTTQHLVTILKLYKNYKDIVHIYFYQLVKMNISLFMYFLCVISFI